MSQAFSPSELVDFVQSSADRGDFPAAWKAFEENFEFLRSSKELAWAFVLLLAADSRMPNKRAELEKIVEYWPEDPLLSYSCCLQLLTLVDGRAACEAIPANDPSFVVIAALERAIGCLNEAECGDPQRGGVFWNLLGNAYRLAGPAFDEKAELAYKRALQIEDRANWRFDLGLFYKNRARWTEGRDTFQKLIDSGASGQPELWNLAICATGALDGAKAQWAWEQIGLKTELDCDGLPQAPGLGMTKILLSSGSIGEALASRRYEQVWVEPLSPCHGIVLNATFYDLGADMGDLVLWDGQAVGQWERDGASGPIFAGLGTLKKGEWRTFRFLLDRGKGQSSEAIGSRMPNRSRIFIFQEEERCESGRVVAEGKLIVCPKSSLEQVKQALLEGLAACAGCQLAVPSLHRSLGEEAEAVSHETLWDSLESLS